MDSYEKPRSLTRDDLTDMLLPKEFAFELNWSQVGSGWECSVKGMVLHADGTKWSISNNGRVVTSGAADSEADNKVAAEEALDHLTIWDKDFRDHIVSYVTKLSRAYSSRVGLFIYGPPASGKTAAASVVAKAARRRFRPTMFIHVWELRDAIRGRLMYKADKTPLDRAKEVELLVLDGLDEDDADERMILTLLDIQRLITARAKQNKLTVLTSQMTATQMQEAGGKWTKFFNSIKPNIIELEAPDADDANALQADKNSKLLDKDAP